MFYISCPLLQDKIIYFVENSKINAKFTKKEGIKLFFDCPDFNDEMAKDLKSEIKNNKQFSALYFDIKKC